jgi:hypothetical protein
MGAARCIVNTCKGLAELAGRPLAVKHLTAAAAAATRFIVCSLSRHDTCIWQRLHCDTVEGHGVCAKTAGRALISVVVARLAIYGSARLIHGMPGIQGRYSVHNSCAARYI